MVGKGITIQPGQMMFAFLMSLITMFMSPVGLAAAPAQPAAAPVAAAQTQFDWLGGTWRTDALEMQCKVTSAGAACREEGRSAAMKGAEADLTFTGAQLKVALPTIPASTFTEIARDGQSVTYEMKTKVGVARLRFTRDGDTLKVERGNDKTYATTMTYQKG
jgi:hypothetical protein